jgi:hypothetical protein
MAKNADCMLEEKQKISAKRVISGTEPVPIQSHIKRNKNPADIIRSEKAMK